LHAPSAYFGFRSARAGAVAFGYVWLGEVRLGGGGGMFFEQTYNSNITACKVDDSVARKREILPVSGTHSFVKQWT